MAPEDILGEIMDLTKSHGVASLAVIGHRTVHTSADFVALARADEAASRVKLRSLFKDEERVIAPSALTPLGDAWKARGGRIWRRSGRCP
jgi:hypothetical protein